MLKICLRDLLDEMADQKSAIDDTEDRKVYAQPFDLRFDG